MTGILHIVRFGTVKVIVSGKMNEDGPFNCKSFNVVLEVIGLIPVRDSDFSLSHARVMLISSLFTFHYRAQNSPSVSTYHIN